jgi:hypothetical protein
MAEAIGADASFIIGAGGKTASLAVDAGGGGGAAGEEEDAIVVAIGNIHIATGINRDLPWRAQAVGADASFVIGVGGKATSLAIYCKSSRADSGCENGSGCAKGGADGNPGQEKDAHPFSDLFFVSSCVGSLHILALPSLFLLFGLFPDMQGRLLSVLGDRDFLAILQGILVLNLIIKGALNTRDLSTSIAI